MATHLAGGEGSSEPSTLFSTSIVGIVLRLTALAVIDAFAVWFAYQLWADGIPFLAGTIVLVTLGINLAFLFERYYPFRWLAPGLALLIIFVIYPTVITVYNAFTNYSTGNLLSRVQAIERIEEKIEYRYLPEGEQYYDSTVYRNEAGDFLLWLVGRDDGALLVAREGEDVVPVTPEDAGLDSVELSEDPTEPPTISGFELTPLGEVGEFAFDFPLTTIEIGPIGEDLDLLAEGYFLDPEGAAFVDNTGRSPTLYNAFAYTSDAGEVALWLAEDDGDNTILARPGKPVVIDGQPQTIGDYRILSNRERLEVADVLPEVSFGAGDDAISVDPFSANRVGRFGQLYEYDDAEDAFVDRATGAVYRPIEGTFTLDPDSVDAEIAESIPAELSPGYFVVIGVDNFERLLTNERLFAPFVRIFIWTVAHALLTVLLTFSLGLALALLMNDTNIPQRKLLRSLILVPYAIPAFISTVVWRGMFDPNLGFINEVLESVFGSAPNWYTDGNSARTRHFVDSDVAGLSLHDADLHRGTASPALGHLRSRRS